MAVTREESPRMPGAVWTWLSGYGTSLLGDAMFYVVLSWAAIQVASPSVVGLILVANALPRALLVTLGGSLVDRLGPKRLIISSDAARVITMLVFGAVAFAGPPNRTTLLVLAAVFGVVDGFFLPAVGSAPPYLAPISAMTRIQALRTIANRLAMFGGPPLASVLIVAGGLSGAAWVVAGLFAASVAALLLTRMRNRVDGAAEADLAQGFWAQLTGGFRVLGTHPTIGLMVALIAVVELGFAGPMTAGPALLAQEHGWGVAGIGVVMGGFGGGAALAALILAVRGRPAQIGRAVLSGLACVGAGVLAVGLAGRMLDGRGPDLVVAGVAAVLVGLGSGVFGTLVNAALVSLAPAAQLGRVMAVVVLAAEGLMPLSLAATGWVTDHTSAGVPFVAGGALILLAAAAGVGVPRIRRLDVAP